jgi:hypothetical protein
MRLRDDERYGTGSVSDLSADHKSLRRRRQRILAGGEAKRNHRKRIDRSLRALKEIA